MTGPSPLTHKLPTCLKPYCLPYISISIDDLKSFEVENVVIHLSVLAK